MLAIYSFSNRYVSLKFWSRVVKESIQSRNVIPASTWSLQKSVLVTQFYFKESKLSDNKITVVHSMYLPKESKLFTSE